MAFTKRTWLDRLTQYPTRKKLTLVSGTTDVYEVTREQGTVTQVGDLVNATNLNDLETRVSTEFTSVNSAISGIAGTTLWTNPNPSASLFNPQTITLSQNISLFTKYEILFYNSYTQLVYINSTGRIPKVHGIQMNCSYFANNQSRYVNAPSGTSLQFLDNYSDASVSNGYCIPYQVIGYK